MGVSALSGLLTVALFLYILLIPMIKGIPPNVRAVDITPYLSRWQLAPMLPCYFRAFFDLYCSIGRGESQGNCHPSFRCVPTLFYFILSADKSGVDPRLGRSVLGFVHLKVLTASMISGWTTLCGVLGKYSGVGYVLGIIGGAYTNQLPCFICS